MTQEKSSSTSVSRERDPVSPDESQAQQSMVGTILQYRAKGVAGSPAPAPSSQEGREEPQEKKSGITVMIENAKKEIQDRKEEKSKKEEEIVKPANDCGGSKMTIDKAELVDRRRNRLNAFVA